MNRNNQAFGSLRDHLAQPGAGVCGVGDSTGRMG